jgi:hypothetical protein
VSEATDSNDEAELALADSILRSVTKIIEPTDKFSTWLVAGSAGAAALVVGNLDGLLTVFAQAELRAVLLLLTLSMLLGFAQKVLAWLVLNTRNVHEALAAQLPELMAKQGAINPRRLAELVSPGIPRVFHWAWNAGVQRGGTDRLSGAKTLSHLCSYQWLLCLSQCLVGFSALIVATLTFG